MIQYSVAERKDLEKVKDFLSLPEIDEQFIKPLSQRDISIEERVNMKYEVGVWVLAHEKGDVLGCLALIPDGKEDTIEISTYAVGTARRGRGIGGKLLDEALEVARNKYSTYKNIILDSWEGNKAIKRLMEKKKYTLIKSYPDIGKRPEGINTLVYQRELN